ncbi:ribosome maturation factor RimP [Candidatus Marithrix sp. Canyon 246]|uniref:ribosome maturation factor RimP n=2 Tax=Candidatus Marithrix sp. Canyon 246 TaxID=1827136 RepID=UPI00084A0B6A|nr:ribosome maturation factor RimP [Candidatus Marithrix sp. Canyon 246]
MMLDQKLQKLLTPVITALGYELWGIELLKQGGSNLILRIYIDHLDGINLDDCQKVSYQVSGVLEVEDPIPGNYTLEVSSPGWDRPLFTLDHFISSIGQIVKVRLNRPLNARRNFSGLIQGVNDSNIILLVDDTEYSLPYDQINKAHIVPK